MKAAFTTIIFLSIALRIYAQGLITHEETQKFQFDFRYEEMSPPESLPNDIIHKMALIKAPTRDYFFGFTLYEKSRIIKLKQNNYRLLLNVDSISYYNKLNYKGYKLDHLVFPNLLNINLQIEDKNSHQEFIISSQKSFSISNTNLFDTLYADTTHAGYFIIKNLAIRCIFTEAQMQKLNEAIAAINKLEELNPGLLQIKTKLLGLQNVKAGMVRIYNIDLKTIEKDLKEMNPHILFSKDLSIELKKEGSLALYDSLVLLARKTRKRFDHMITMPEYEYYSEGYHALRNGKREVAKSYFIKSISQKPSYPPPYYALAEMAYQNQQWDSCARTILHILNDLKPDFTIRKNTLLLGSKLYNTITYEADNMIIKSQINEAIKILYIATNLCQATHEMVCSGKAITLLKKAKSDLFYSWISITNQSILNNKVALSLNYLEWTESFYKENRVYLAQSAEVDSLKINLIHLLLVNASAKYNSGLYQKAIDYTNLADSLCSVVSYRECKSELEELKVKSYSGLYNNLLRQSRENVSSFENKSHLAEKAEILKTNHPELIHTKTDSLDQKTASTNYRSLINQGLKFLMANDFNKAYQQFREAVDLEGVSTVEPNDSLSFYLKQAAKPIILSDLKAGDLQAWGIHYKAVQTIIKMSREEALKAGLENDSDIAQAIARLENLIYENKCAEASKNYTQNIQTASQNIRFYDYLSADKNWNQAIDLATKNPECNLDINIPLNLKKKYRQIIAYQNILADAKSLIASQKDSLAFTKFLYSMENFSADSLALFGASKTNAIQFAKASKSTEFQYFTIKWILKNKENNLVLEGMQQLLPFYNKKSKYASILKQAAQQQARLDKKTGNSFSPRERAEKIFSGNKELIKVYLKTYRKS